MILIVEDESVARMALTSLLRSSGYSTTAVGSAEEALQMVQEHGVPEVALVDLDLPGMDGLALIRQLEQENPNVYSVLITAASPERVNAMQQDDCHAKYLRKPLHIDDLLTLLPDADRAQ